MCKHVGPQRGHGLQDYAVAYLESQEDKTPNQMMEASTQLSIYKNLEDRSFDTSPWNNILKH
jgi:hypothetical protein